MKRFFKISLLILIIVLCMGVFVACDDNTSNDNNKSEPVNTECEHNYVNCVCTKCGDISHSYVEEVINPTCEEKGYTKHKCSVCNDEYKDTYTNELGHNYVDGVCSRCEDVDPNYTPDDPTPGDPEPDPEQHTHSYTDEVIDPTCTEKGYTKHTCACGETYNDAETSALGHNFIDGVCTRCEAKDPDYVAELDFSGLEEKLEDVINAGSKFYKLADEGVISYSINSDTMYVITEQNYNANSKIDVYAIKLTDELTTQDDIDDFIDALEYNDLSSVITLLKTKSDITIGDDTYSKDGIEGDNVFAEQCGVTEGAILTYVSSLQVQSYANTDTGYGRGSYVLVIYEENDELMVNFSDFVVESQSSYTNEQLYTNLITDGKHYVYGTPTVIEMGENLKK